MTDDSVHAHSHVFLGANHARAERATWAVVWLCAVTMVVEIAGGWMAGSLALIADGVHMATHVAAFLLAAVAYALARRYANDPRFAFGTGKIGDLAAFSSAVILAFVAAAVAFEALSRLMAPTPIAYGQAIVIALFGLIVNVASAILLHGARDHGHGHGHAHGDEESRQVVTSGGTVELSIVEVGRPARFHLRGLSGQWLDPALCRVTIRRANGAAFSFDFRDVDVGLESLKDIPEPHEFAADLVIGEESFPLVFKETAHGRGVGMHDNNFRAALLHVVADAAVSALVIAGLIFAGLFGWTFLDPLAALVGAGVVASWAASLMQDAGGVLLDVTPDHAVAQRLRAAIEHDGDSIADFHLWRLGPGHLGAIVSIVTATDRNEAYYRARLGKLTAISHLTIEVRDAA